MRIKILAVNIGLLPLVMYAQPGNDTTKSKWSGSFAGYYYFIPDEKIPPTLTGFTDFKSLHLEARYNYEDKNSFSLFTGKNFERQYGKFDLVITPMAGVVVGHTNGILPGLEFSASYSVFNLYSENEYMLDFKGKENYFFYSWTELNAQLLKNLKAGVLAQSLRWYKTQFDVQRGVYAEYSLGQFTFDVYYFNPFTGFNFTMAAMSLEF